VQLQFTDKVLFVNDVIIIAYLMKLNRIVFPYYFLLLLRSRILHVPQRAESMSALRNLPGSSRSLILQTVITPCVFVSEVLSA